jgi:ABC-type antimicrobial peptide transport system permease subunit
MDQLLRTERLLAFVSASFGLWAVALAAVGLGGMLFYAVSRRTAEIGVRIALGAARADVVRMVLGESIGMIGAGLVIGLPFAYAVGRVLESTLFELKALDPLTTAVAVSALLLVAVTAAWFPARRAARIDPVEALREE